MCLVNFSGAVSRFNWFLFQANYRKTIGLMLACNFTVTMRFAQLANHELLLVDSLAMFTPTQWHPKIHYEQNLHCLVGLVVGGLVVYSENLTL